MNSPVFGLRVAGTVFGLMSLAQLARLVIRPQILVAGHELPLWPSAIAVVFLACMSFWMWRLSRKSKINTDELAGKKEGNTGREAAPKVSFFLQKPIDSSNRRAYLFSTEISSFWDSLTLLKD